MQAVQEESKEREVEEAKGREYSGEDFPDGVRKEARLSQNRLLIP